MSSVQADDVFVNFHTPENATFYAADPYENLKANRKEIRLLALLPGNENETIRCKLIEPPYSTFESYECISYCAGDAKETEQIEINGLSFYVFASLGAALRKLRYQNKRRILWADQICINQSDVFERCIQVQQMGSIFENAKVVIAWLGITPMGHVAQQEFQYILTRYQDAEARFTAGLPIQDQQKQFSFEEAERLIAGVAQSYYEYLSDDNIDNDEEYLDRCSALGKLFRSKYWSRLWIVQEIILATSIVLVWDTCSVTWADMRIVTSIMFQMAYISYLIESDVPHTVRYLTNPLKDGSESYVSKISYLIDHQHNWRGHQLRIGDLLFYARTSACTDPRDRVFATCGLMAKQYNITADYTISPQAVYCNVVKSIITADRTLDVLSLIQHGLPVDRDKDDGTLLDLPSWCLDWSARHVHVRQILSSEFISLRNRFDATKGSVINCTWPATGEHEDDLPKSQCIYITGLIVATVEDIGPIPAADTHDTFRDNFDEKLTVLQDSWASLVRRQREITPQLVDELEKTVTLDDCGVADVEIPRSGALASTYRQLQFNALKGRRRFIVTSSGYMGMAPPHVQVGDLACVLFGARVPFLLRKQDDHYTLVGEAYLSDGFMFGRAMDMLKAGELREQVFEVR